MNIGINGFGRIGRAVFRRAWRRQVHTCVHINDVYGDVGNLAYLLQHDTVDGRFEASVKVCGGSRLVVEGERRRWEVGVSAVPIISDIGWARAGVDCVVESSGADHNIRTARDVHGVRHIIVTTHDGSADTTVVFGVNDHRFDPAVHRVVATSICDAIAIAPVLRALLTHVQVDHCFVTTLHPWLSYQNVLDGPVRSPSHASDYSLGRSSIGALIPKHTTVAEALEDLLPDLRNRITAFSYRVPTAAVCTADLSIVLSSAVDKPCVESMFAAVPGGVLRCSDQPLVSSDFQGESASAVVDLRWLVSRGRHVKAVLWYDNEVGYAHRVVDLLDRCDGVLSSQFSATVQPT